MAEDIEQAESFDARKWTIRQRFDYLNRVLRAGETEHPIASVVVDGYEEGSAIVLVRDGGRSIVFHGAQAMLSPTRMQAIVGAVLRRSIPRFKNDTLEKIADVVWSLATMRNIYDSVDSATGYGRSYVYAATVTAPILGAGGKVDGKVAWPVFDELQREETAADNAGVTPRACVVPWADGERLVIRTWFHRHVQRDLGHAALSEQHIASLMGMAGWTSLARPRSALTVHNPADNSDTVQFRFYVVPEGWEGAVGDDAGGPE